MSRTHGAGAAAWILAVVSPVVGVGAVLALGVDWSTAAVMALIAGVCAVIGLIKESQWGDASRRRTLHLTGLVAGAGVLLVSQVMPYLFMFGAM
ncbi:hypothetical protein P8605_08350 [Streptomyces sp. T-3]|nr:hypothetical protein [Streptomyces sp. T-3]